MSPPFNISKGDVDVALAALDIAWEETRAQTVAAVFDGKRVDRKEDTMVSTQLKHQIESFVANVGEPYVRVERVSSPGFHHIAERYIPVVVALSEKTKRAILEQLEDSWRNNQDHGKIRDWGRAASGTARFLLLPTDPAEVNLQAAVDVVARLSRWHHSHGSNIWKRFIPTATYVIEQAWGSIEKLHDEYCEP